MFRGTIDILGLVLKCDLLLSQDEIKVDVAMSPIRIANNLLILTKSAKDVQNGPQLFIKITKKQVN